MGVEFLQSGAGGDEAVAEGAGQKGGANRIGSFLSSVGKREVSELGRG